MAFTDVINTTGAIFQIYPQMSVYLGDASGNVPTVPDDVFTDVYCTRVVQSAGGSRLDFAELDHKFTASLANRNQPADFARMIQVDLPDTGATRIHLGDYVTEAIAIGQEMETLKAQSQLRPYHFGTPVVGYKVYDPITAAFVIIEDDIVFNPVIDDRTEGNQSDVISDAPLLGYVWTHPELADTATGETYQGQSRTRWSLRTATEAICELLNEDEDFILRPTNYTPLSTAPPIRNVKIPLGQRLHEALDTLLIPHGFNWYVDYTAATPTMTIFEIGVGDEKELKFQAPFSTLNLEESNCNELSVSNAIGDSFNAVTVYGEFEEVELTLPLYPAWAAAGDAIDPLDLAKDGSQYAGNETVWRLFIANEAGDIDPAVSRFGVLPAVPDLSTVFTKYIPHRRVLGEPLTYLGGEDDGGYGATASGTDQPHRRPIVVEWSDDAGATWKLEEATWTIKLCPDQIGILFDGKDAPTEFFDAGNDFRIRITGTVFGDARVNATAPKQAWSVNARTFTQVLSLPEKFQHRWRQGSGTYASSLAASGIDADERDDTATALSYAEELRDKNHYADVECEFKLPGWHTEYKIGDLITKIAGREINLDAAPATAPANRYVQITERRFEMDKADGPSTILIVDRGVRQ